ncbi:MAG: pimeloyl-ACP methyl ester carboxylesterase [Candidatus Paceibacteria bacterium]|jgi:pimeloyl-ACP methyl ester carboxylesterase
MTEIRNSAGELLDCSWTQAAGPETHDPELIVIGHGVTANKDREWALVLSQALSQAGFASLRFSFAGNGDSQGDFRESTPSKEAGDLLAVLDHCPDYKVTYVGHSMGAAVGVLVASKDARIERLVSVGGMVDTADFARRKFGDQVAGESFMWDKPECPLSQAFMDDMKGIGSVDELAEDVLVPWLFVHGTEDSVVPIEESELMLTRTGGSADFADITGADHVFSGDASKAMSERIVRWLLEH